MCRASSDEVADEMIADPEFAMSVLAHLAYRADECAFHKGCDGSAFHNAVPAFLEATAGGLRAAQS